MSATPHVQLTGEQRFRLGQLVREAAKRMPPAAGQELEALFGRLAADNRHLRDRNRGLNQLANHLRDAAKMPALATVKVWRNEDGKEFLFADDVREALGFTRVGDRP